ncbi:putative quinol monooxygenase [Nonomuraea sp. NPDC050783]|uniref:putative quinol monooxygenase n=1 Tax=Nonomuraea sp. NPDC050783 TaxID=3154634 RepID=UPI0034661196
MVIVAGRGYVDPRQREALLTSLEASLRRTRTEPGCLDYVVAADPVEPGRVNVYERWESEEHLAAHLAAMTPPEGPAPAVLDMEITRYEIAASSPFRA